MSPSAPMSDPEELLAHSSWVHALAASLVHDASLANDVVQDTWVAALKQPPRTTKVRSWLAAVVMNSVRQRQRAQTRRENREKIYAPDESLASTEEIVEIESERRRVVDAVLLLHEPYRRTLLLRYWSDLSADEIARREGIPSSTVRNRLRRALQRVRAELDRRGEKQSRRALKALVAFAPPLSMTAKASTSSLASLSIIGAVMMNGKSMVVAAFVLLSIVGWKVLVADASRPPSPPTSTADSSKSRAHFDQPFDSDKFQAIRRRVEHGQPSGDRRLEKTQVPPESTNPITPEASLFGSVNDEQGRPIIGAQIRLEFGDSQRGLVRTQTSGEYSLAGIPSGKCHVHCEAIGFQSAQASLTLDPAGTRWDLTLRPEIEIAIKFRSEEGEPLLDLMNEEKTTSALLRNSLFVVATEETPPKVLAEICPSDRYGCGLYRSEHSRNPEKPDGFIVCDREPPLYLSAVLGNVVLRTKRVDQITEKVEFWLSPADIEDLGSTIKFRVVEKSTGLPFQSHVVVAVGSPEMVCIGRSSDSQGHYIFEREAFGRVGLWVRTRGYQPHFQFLHVERGETVDVGTIELLPSLAISGRVLYEQASNAGAWLYEYSLDDLKPSDTMPTQAVFNQTESDGGFRIDGWHGRLLVVARPKNQEFGLAAAVVDTREGPVQGVEIPVKRAATVTLRPGFLEGTTVRILNDRGLPLWAHLVTGKPRSVSLADGTYTAEAWRGEELIDRVLFNVENHQPVEVDIGE